MDTMDLEKIKAEARKADIHRRLDQIEHRILEVRERSGQLVTHLRGPEPDKKGTQIQADVIIEEVQQLESEKVNLQKELKVLEQ